MNKAYGIAVPLAILAAWWAVTAAGWVAPIFMPAPSEVASLLWNQLFVTGEMLLDAVATLERMLTGYFIAVILGISTGLIMGSSARVYALLEPTIDFFRSIPATALFPLFLLFFGIGDEAKIAVAIWACSFIIIVNTVYGVRNASRLRLMAAKVMKAERIGLFTKVILPEALPHVFAGLRIALSFALIVVIVTEMFIGTNVGLGHRIIDAQMVYNTPEMYAAIILAGILGYALNMIFLALERRIVHWSGR